MSNYLKTTVIVDDMAALHVHNVSPVTSHEVGMGKFRVFVGRLGWNRADRRSKRDDGAGLKTNEDI